MDIITRLNENSAKLNGVKKSVNAFVEALTDKKSFVEMGVFTSGTTFADGVCAEGEGVVTGYAAISGIPVYLFVQNFEAMRGSFSLAQAKKIENCMNMAAKSGIPFISIIDSAGARLSEGVGVLEGYSKIIKLASALKNQVPHIAVIKGACAGHMSAYACTADVVLFDEKGYMSLTSPSVVAAKADKKQDVIKLFGAENAMKSGVASLSYKTAAQLKGYIAEILRHLGDEREDGENPNRTAKGLSENISDENLLAAVCDKGKYIELSSGFGKVRTVLTRMNGRPTGIISASDKLTAEDFIKIQKFIKLTDGYYLPLITLVNSDGAADLFEDEQKGISALAAEAFTAVSLSDNPKIAVITGTATGLSYSLLASKGAGFDYSLAFAGAAIAPLSAETAVNFFDVELKTKNPVGEREKLIAAYTEREGNPFLSAKDGYVDNIINPDDVRPYLCSVLSSLS